MTLKEFAKQTGIAYSTTAAYAQKAGWTKNGVKTELSDIQITAILEAVKQKANAGVGEAAKLMSNLEGVNTAMSRALRIDLLHRQIEAEKDAEITELKAVITRQSHEITGVKQALADEVMDHRGTKQLLTEQMTGTAMYQRISESAGSVTTDQEDMIGLYRREKQQ